MKEGSRCCTVTPLDFLVTEPLLILQTKSDRNIQGNDRLENNYFHFVCGIETLIPRRK